MLIVSDPIIAFAESITRRPAFRRFFNDSRCSMNEVSPQKNRLNPESASLDKKCRPYRFAARK